MKQETTKIPVLKQEEDLESQTPVKKQEITTTPVLKQEENFEETHAAQKLYEEMDEISKHNTRYKLVQH